MRPFFVVNKCENSLFRVSYSMLQLIKTILEEYKWIPEMLALAAAVSLLFKRVRSVSTFIFKGLWSFFTFPFKSQGYIKNISESVQSLILTSESTARDVAALKEIIGYNGGTGLMDQVGFIVGYQSAEFSMRDHPGFICDESGRNVDCTHGYCELLNINSRSDLLAGGWKSYADKDELRGYIADFLDVAARRETFRSSIGLFDANGEDLGTWLVIAHPLSSPKAKTPRYMGFLYPFGAVSQCIAKEKGWPMAPPL